MFVTGPLYPPQPEKINDIPVPSKFYKVIYAYKADKAIGFLFPNKAVETAQVWDYAMSVAELEKESGLSFFSNFRAKKQNQLETDCWFWLVESRRRGRWRVFANFSDGLLS